MLAQLTDKSLAGPNPLDSLKPMIPPPKIYQLYKDPSVNTAPPPNYLKYTQVTTVSQELIDQLGGLQDTIKPMEESLR